MKYLIFWCTLWFLSVMIMLSHMEYTVYSLERDFKISKVSENIFENNVKRFESKVIKWRKMYESQRVF